MMDHRPLCRILGHDQGVPTMAAARMQRWALILSTYQYKLEFTPGGQNQCADCMSRLPLSSSLRDNAKQSGCVLLIDTSTLPVTAAEMAKATKRDNTLAVVLRKVCHGHWPESWDENLAPFVRRRTELTCHDSCILWGQRVVIPRILRRRLLSELHEGHLGICRMKALARSYIWWPGMDKEIEKMAAHCEACKSIGALPPAAPRHPWQCPAVPWDRIHVDFSEFNRQQVLVVVDAYTKWPEVKYLSSTTAQRTIEVLHNLFANHGFP